MSGPHEDMIDIRGREAERGRERRANAGDDGREEEAARNKQKRGEPRYREPYSEARMALIEDPNDTYGYYESHAAVTRSPEVLGRLRRAQARLPGLLFMFLAGAGYMAANPSSLDLTTLLGYESDGILLATFDHAGIVTDKAGRSGGLVGALKSVDITVKCEGTEGSHRVTSKAIKVFKLGDGPSLYATMHQIR
jgi:hypothetical protein